MQVPAQLQEFLLERGHFDPKFAREAKRGEVIALAGRLQHLAARRAKVRSNGPFVTAPANKGRVSCVKGMAHALQLILSRRTRRSNRTGVTWGRNCRVSQP